jgi:NitT/TauT family transport system substrate-binding protein
LIRTLATGAAVAGGGALAACALPSGAASIAEPGPPETTAVRIVTPPECCPGMGLAESYLRDEGFTQISIVPALPFTTRKWLVGGLADVAPAHPEFIVATIDAGLPLTVLAGLHSSCLELWAVPGIATVGDLRGRRISVRSKDKSDQFFVFFAALLGYVGIDPLKDVHFVEAGVDEYARMISAYAEGRADAVLAGGAQGPILRRLNAPGHVIFDTMTAKPWSQYGCCHLVANRDWAHQNPNAAKRVTRAVLRATDEATRDPARAARDYAAAGLGNKDASLVTAAMAMTKYNWRDADPEETVRFFGLRLLAAKVIESTPQQLIAAGLDLAYAKQLRGELKS